MPPSLDRYDGILFDAFGVLVDKRGPLPGAIELMTALKEAGKPYLILTNSASRTAAHMANEFRSIGLPVDDDQIINSGMLVSDHIRQNGLAGKRSLVLGTELSKGFVSDAGGVLVDIEEGVDADVIVVADQMGFELLDGINAVVSLILRRLDAGEPPTLLLCNPDLIFPKGPGSYGVTAGGLVAMFEQIMVERYGDEAPRFLRLGKPHAPIFELAARELGSKNLVMIGDQLATDILGANHFGIDSILVNSGLAGNAPAATAKPDFSVSGLADLLTDRYLQ
ncbi:MAG: HAD-IIA family hydrolase [Gammaproteobacteria bacterium]